MADSNINDPVIAPNSDQDVGLRPREALQVESATAATFTPVTSNWGQYGGDNPPEFSPYESPYHWNSGNGVVLRASDLNEDGEALYRFLLSQAENPPNFVVHCKGYRQMPNGGSPQTQAQDQAQAAGFDFKIELTPHLLQGVKWTVSDDEPAYRGKIVREKEVQNGMWLEPIVTTDQENREASDWKQTQQRNGFGPWVPMGGLDNANAQPALGGTAYRSSKTLRDWTGEYCSSDKILKEFVFDKVVYGWNLETLEKSIEGLIRSTYFQGKLEIKFIVTSNKVFVKPDNALSRILGYIWVKVLLWVVLLYPFIWVWERFWPQGGGKWKVAGAAYPLKQWVHAEDSIKGETVLQYLIRKGEMPAPPPYVPDQKTPIPLTTTTGPMGGPSSSSAPPSENNITSRFKQTPRGISQLVGVREGEWFKQWEATILRAVLTKLNRQNPLINPNEVIAESAGAMLDGYN